MHIGERMRGVGWGASVLAAMLIGACAQDDDESGDGSTAGDDGSAESSTGSGTAAEGGETGPGSEGTTAAADDTTSDASDGGSESGGREGSLWGALVIGTLARADLDAAQAMHDEVAMGGQPIARELGDVGHTVVLGTDLLGTTMDEFVAIDRWTDLQGALSLYGDPDFGAAMSMLFARPPSLELFEQRDDWYGWGDLDTAADGERWFVVVRGTLASRDLAAAQQTHDMLAMAGEADAAALGDVAHVVWLGSEDEGTAAPVEFFAVDVWTDDANIEAFYGNPDFQAAFGMLFAEPPRVGVYRSTDWYQW